MKISLPSRYWLIPFLCAMGSIYFLYHTVHGTRGIIRMRNLQQEIKVAKIKATEIRQTKELLQAKTAALKTRLDLDLLEESALNILNMGKADSVILFEEKDY